MAINSSHETALKELAFTLSCADTYKTDRTKSGQYVGMRGTLAMVAHNGTPENQKAMQQYLLEQMNSMHEADGLPSCTELHCDFSNKMIAEYLPLHAFLGKQFHDNFKDIKDGDVLTTLIHLEGLDNEFSKSRPTDHVMSRNDLLADLNFNRENLYQCNPAIFIFWVNHESWRQSSLQGQDLTGWLQAKTIKLDFEKA